MRTAKAMPFPSRNVMKPTAKTKLQMRLGPPSVPYITHTCTPRYDVTLDRFMRVAHPLPRRRGNHTFVNALPWMCRTGAPWKGLPGRRRGAPGPSASPRGRNAKVHMVSDSEGTVVEIHLSPGDEHDEAFLADLRLILGATYLKKYSQKPN